MRFGRGGCIAADAAFATLLDHHLLGTAVAEALLHRARLDARFERQGLGRDSEFLLAGRILVNHSSSPNLVASRAFAQSVLANSWPHCRPSCRRPPSGIGPGSGCATGTSCWPGSRAAQHVPHLTAPVPNPIVRSSER